MRKSLRYGLSLLAFFSFFFISGRLGLAAEVHTQSVAAGVGLFNVTFVGLTTGFIRALTYFI